MKNLIPIAVLCCGLFLISCDKGGSSTTSSSASPGLKIAYVNGDTILMNYKEFRAQSQTMDAKQKDAEDMLQQKGAALEREYNEYQRNAQKGTMTGKEMQAQEKYLSSKQEALLAERDKLAKEIMDETTSINDRLQKVMQDKLAAIKKREGYDFIFSYIHGGAILLADEKYDITAEVLKELNSEAGDHPMEKDSAK
ncbi:MAG: OmpH family outer membrane protein [Saprospiraceae bacterium]|uniref:OmpH family outer membrane protein n=1 Tax=Candidatus Opimibacter skivensis TaxID=2982028 RepID=A0A9D7XRN9_9BACT|nr:OmpH family outer membrane protein [Candidatus Opimibacter skivensis]